MGVMKTKTKMKMNDRKMIHKRTDIYLCYGESMTGTGYSIRGVVERRAGPKGGNVEIRWFGYPYKKLTKIDIGNSVFRKINISIVETKYFSGEELVERGKTNGTR